MARCWQATPLIAGLSVAAVALTARAGIQYHAAWKAAGPRLRNFYEGGFEQVMDKREAALILGLRCASVRVAAPQPHAWGFLPSGVHSCLTRAPPTASTESPPLRCASRRRTDAS